MGIPDELLFYQRLNEKPQPWDFIIAPLSTYQQLTRGLSFLQPRFSRPPHGCEKWPITGRLVNDLLYLISDRYNAAWSQLESIAELSISSFISIFILCVLPWNQVILRLSILSLLCLHILLLDSRKCNALELACEGINNVTGRLGVMKIFTF